MTRYFHLLSDHFNYQALAFVLHTDKVTAKRWWFAWCHSAGSKTLFRILQHD